MDMQTDKWFAQLKLSGIGRTMTERGNLIHIMSWTLAQLKQNRSHKTLDGAEISLLIRDRPFGQNEDASESVLRLAAEVEAGLDQTKVTREPLPNETYEQYLQYLLDSDLNPNTASYIADEWFGVPPNPALLDWMTDEKAIRFRELNYNTEAFEQATTAEYLALKQHVIQKFPQFTKSLAFRIA